VRSPAPPETAPTIRGECPSVHEPFAEVDGALARIRFPGGVLGAAQVRSVVAAARGGTTLEITSRANLQIRGVAPAARQDVTRLLVAGGVTADDGAADGRRNVMASPTAGLDPQEVLDSRSVVAEVVTRLVGHQGSLSPKFGVIVDGGGAVHVRGLPHDLCLGAVRQGQGGARFEVCLGRALPTGDRQGPAALLHQADVGRFVTAALELVGGAPLPAGRMRALVREWGHEESIALVARRAGITVEMVGPEELAPAPGPSARPLGIRRARQRGFSMVGAMPVLGRLSADTLAQVGELAAASGHGDLRLTPWRSLLLTRIASGDAEFVLARLGDLGLVVDPADPAAHVVACAGNTGCPAGLTDAQGDGRRLVEMLRAAGPTDPPAVHISGCAKRCAAGGREFAVTLEGGPLPGRYVVIRHDGPGGAPESAPPGTALTPAEALQSVTAPPA
jgi:precorrin-3B synthase